MSGEELRKRLTDGGYTVNSIAKLLGKKSQDISQILNKTADIKTGFLEELCKVLKVDLSFFYGGSEYLTIVSIPNADATVVPKFLYDELKESTVAKTLYNELKEEIYEYRDRIKDLENQISLMQQGLTIPEIAQKEVG